MCFRRADFGHFATACTAVLCIYCERASHEAKNGPLLSMPKPTAITYGLCCSELMFNEVPASDDLKFKHKSGKVGQITVSGDPMTAQQIIKELEWIVPGEHQWDLLQKGDNCFQTHFPSKEDLTRLNELPDIPIHNSSLHFEEWSSALVNKYRLEETWLRSQVVPTS